MGNVCAKEHDKLENVKVIANRNTLLIKEVLINLLLTDRVFQNSQAFDLHNDFIAML